MLNLSTNLPAAEVCSTIVLETPGSTVITRGFDQHSLSKRASVRQDGHPRPEHISSFYDMLKPLQPLSGCQSSNKR